MREPIIVVRRVNGIYVANKRVVYVDPLGVPEPVAIPRMERFPKSKWEPANSKSEAAAEEPDIRRPIEASAKPRARIPAPPAADISPASIIKGRKSPRAITHQTPPQSPKNAQNPF